MPQLARIPYSTLNTEGLLAAYNGLADPRRVARLKRWSGSRCALVERIALLRTVPIPAVPAEPEAPAKKQRTVILSPLQKSAMRELQKIACWRDPRTRSLSPRQATPESDALGYPLAFIIQRLRHGFPEKAVTEHGLRLLVARARRGDPLLAAYRLPMRRIRLQFFLEMKR